VGEHNATYVENGAVSFGKFGAPLSDYIVTSIQAAVATAGARLYVVVKQGGAFTAASAIIVSIQRDCRRGPIKDFFPRYYRELYDKPSSCIMLGSKLEPAPIGHLHLVSNGRLLLDVLQQTRTSAMLVNSI
jgi:hypothetical protein